jgi:hypothetical protein
MELWESNTKIIKKAIIEPKNKDPVSPRNTFLEALKLCIKKPIRAPIIIGKNRNISLLEIRIIPPRIKKNLIETNDAKPSKPSIKFKALTTTTKTNMEIKKPAQSGISKIPKTP